MKMKNESNEKERAARAKRRSKKGKNNTLPANKTDKGLQKKYRRLLSSLSMETKRVVNKHLMPVINNIDPKNLTESDVSSINKAFDNIGLQADILSSLAIANAKQIIYKMNSRNKDKFMDAARKTIGINISDVVASKGINEKLKVITEQNIDLIKSVPDVQLSKIKSYLLNELSLGRFESSELKKKLKVEFGVSERRAQFIAQDQSHKINAALTMIRNNNIGINKYIWRNSNDMRVRGRADGLYPKSKYNHWNREGKVYYYSSPPADGNPGQPYGCRCYAEAVIPEINQKN